MTRSFAFLVNPLSGGGAAPAAVVPVARALRDAGCTVDVTYSPGQAGCRALVAEAVAREDIVVAVGGDGMAASLAGAVVDHDGVLGIVPSGRGNDFARALGIDPDPAAVAAGLLSGRERRVDVIGVQGAEAPERIVLGSVYAGVDSLASAHVDRAHRLPRSLQYPYAAVRSILEARPATYTVSVDGEQHPRATVCQQGFLNNSRWYGSGMHIAPDARVDDGVLDVVVVGATTRRRLLGSFRRVYDGSHVSLPDVVVLRGREVTVAADGPVAYGDGERLGPLPVTGRVKPGALRVLGG